MPLEEIPKPLAPSLQPLEWDAMALVGRIARAHGNRGQVIVNADTDFPEERFRPGSELFVNHAGVVKPLKVTGVRFQHERPVMAFDGVDTMNDAEALAGCELRVPVDALMALPAGSYYRHELVGCRVETGEGQTVGVVRDVEGTLHESRLVVAGSDGEVLIPLVAEICTRIDAGAKRIVIEPPEGLLELNR